MEKWPDGRLQELHHNCPGQGYCEGVPVYAQYVGQKDLYYFTLKGDSIVGIAQA